MGDEEAAVNGIVVYRKVGVEERTCEYGEKHRVHRYVEATIYPTGRTWPMNNGYEQRQEAVYADADGREYKRFVAIDFFNNVSYRGPGGTWWPRRSTPFEMTELAAAGVGS